MSRILKFIIFTLLKKYYSIKVQMSLLHFLLSAHLKKKIEHQRRFFRLFFFQFWTNHSFFWSFRRYGYGRLFFKFRPSCIFKSTPLNRFGPYISFLSPLICLILRFWHRQSPTIASSSILREASFFVVVKTI